MRNAEEPFGVSLAMNEMTSGPMPSPDANVGQRAPGASIGKVWIDEGCIACSLCMDLVPEVFEVPDGELCFILPEAATHFSGKHAEIIRAAEDCPVEVIKVE